VSPKNRKLIGQILCEKGYLKQSQLEQALAEQKKGEYRPLGQILLELGYVTIEELDEAFAIQAQCKART
jgi:type IV pilus assembly protein PilB